MRLNHVTLPAVDVARSADFYRRLGLIQIVADYPGYARFQSPEGEMTLSLQHVDRAPAQPGASIHFEVDDVDGAVRELEHAGFAFVSGPLDEPYLWREAILLDPDGHRVFVYHAGDNRLDPPWRLAREVVAEERDSRADASDG